MPLSSSAREELAHLKPRKKYCRLAELSALIRMDGSIHLTKGEISLSMESGNPAVARKILLLLKDQFDIATELAVVKQRTLKKQLKHVIFVAPQPALKYALKKLGILDDDLKLKQNLPEELLKDQSCVAAYFRGSFLGGGSISEPKHGYHMEIATTNRTFADELRGLLELQGLNARIHSRKKDHAVYLKEADDIESFLAMIGAHDTVLKLENMRIVRMLKGEVNRMVNFEAANLKKSASAAVQQIEDIQVIVEHLGISAIPKALREIARARLKAPTAGIEELGRSQDPPLSKSAVYHRLRRIHELARGLRLR